MEIGLTGVNPEFKATELRPSSYSASLLSNYRDALKGSHKSYLKVLLRKKTSIYPFILLRGPSDWSVS